MNQPVATDESSTPSSEETVVDRATKKEKSKHRWAAWLGCLCVFALFSSWLVPRISFVFHTIVNFQLQLVFLLVLSAFFVMRGRRYFVAFLLLLCAVLPAWNLASLYGPAEPVESTTRTIRIMAFNVWKSGTGFEETLQMIKDEDCDVIGLSEYNRRWREFLQDNLPEYPHRIARTGMVIFSKFPIIQPPSRIVSTNPSFHGWMESRFWVDDQLVHFIMTHTLSPRNHGRLVERNGQFKALAERSLQLAQHMHVVIAGDFNGTTHDYELSSMVAEAELKDSRQGFGWQNSWPTWFWPISICIDHCFVSQGVKVESRRRGSNVGSDHLPVIVELSFAKHAKEHVPGEKGIPPR